MARPLSFASTLLAEPRAQLKASIGRAVFAHALDLLSTNREDSAPSEPEPPPEELDDCPICLEPPGLDARELPCGHVLCGGCLLKLEAHATAAQRCPTCRHPLPAAPLAPRQCETYQRIVEALEASIFTKARVHYHHYRSAALSRLRST